MFSNKRLVYHYDIQVDANKENATPPPMRDVISALAEQVGTDNAILPISNDTATLQLCGVNFIEGEDCAVLFVRVSNRNAPDAIYSDLEAGKSRVLRKEGNEGRDFGAHLLISLSEVVVGSNRYLALLEKNQGLHRGHVLRLLQAVLRNTYKNSDEFFTCPDPSGARRKDGSPKKINFRPMLSLVGHPSPNLIRELEEGEIKDFVLIRSVPKQQLTGKVWLEPRQHVLRLKEHAGLRPVRKVWDALKDLVQTKSKEGFQRARVKFQGEDGAIQSVELDAGSGAVNDDRYVKASVIDGIDPPLDESAEGIVEHFSERMVELYKALV